MFQLNNTNLAINRKFAINMTIIPTNILYIHGMGGGGDSRIPRLLKEQMDDVQVLVRTYSFDPEIAANQIAAWMEELHPALVIGESLGSIHALRLASRICSSLPPWVRLNTFTRSLSWLIFRAFPVYAAGSGIPGKGTVSSLFSDRRSFGSTGTMRRRPLPISGSMDRRICILPSSGPGTITVEAGLSASAYGRNISVRRAINYMRGLILWKKRMFLPF